MIRVLVADDHAVVREGIKRIITEAGDLTVAGEAANGSELLARVTNGAWDLVVMDLAMPGMAGLEVLRDLRRFRPRLPILVLSMYPEEQYGLRALQAGASGYLNKGCPPDTLLAAIRTLLSGKRYFSEDLGQRLALHVDEVSLKPAHDTLSNREFQVLRMLGSGSTVSEIARELSLSVKTVSTFRRRVLEKLGLRHNADLTRYAIKHGLVE